MSEAAVLLGDGTDQLDLNDGPPLGAASYYFETLAGNWDPGSPEAVRRTQQSWLQDGVQESITGYGNRTRTLQVRVTGESIDALDDAEVALTLALSGRTTITFQLPDQTNVTVFEVLGGYPTEEFDDLGQVLRNQRIYTLTLTCLPWAHGPSLTTTTLAAFSTAFANTQPTSGWSVVSGGATLANTTVGGVTAKQVDPPTGTGPVTVVLDYAGSISGSTYVAFGFATDGGGTALSWIDEVTVNGAAPVAMIDGGAFVQMWFPKPVGHPQVSVMVSPRGEGTTRTFFVSQLSSLTSSLPSATGGTVVALPIAGSKRTLGSLSAAGFTSGLTVYADQTLLTHKWHPSVMQSWPQAPAGTYAVFLNVAASAGDVLTVTTQSPAASAPLMSQATRATTTNPVNGLGYPIGLFVLAGSRDGRVGKMTWAATVAGSTVTLVRQLTILRVDADTSLMGCAASGFTRLQLDAPSADFPNGGLWGTDVNGDVWDVLYSAKPWSYPVLLPGPTGLFVTPSPNAGVLSASYYANFLNYAVG